MNKKLLKASVFKRHKLRLQRICGVCALDVPKDKHIIYIRTPSGIICSHMSKDDLPKYERVPFEFNRIRPLLKQNEDSHEKQIVADVFPYGRSRWSRPTSSAEQAPQLRIDSTDKRPA